MGTLRSPKALACEPSPLGAVALLQLLVVAEVCKVEDVVNNPALGHLVDVRLSDLTL